MTIDTAAFNAMKDLVGGRVFPDVAPVKTARPYITYQQFGGQVKQCLDKSLLSKENCYLQINVFADTRLQATDIAKQAEAAIVASTAFQASPISNRINTHDADLNRYGTRQDFSIWIDR